MASNKYPVIVDSTGASIGSVASRQEVKAVNCVALGVYGEKSQTLCGRGSLGKREVYHH